MVLDFNVKLCVSSFRILFTCKITLFIIEICNLLKETYNLSFSLVLITGITVLFYYKVKTQACKRIGLFTIFLFCLLFPVNIFL